MVTVVFYSPNAIKTEKLKNDLQLVKFIIQHMNANELYSIADLISPEFVFTSPQQGTLTFKQYCNYISVLSQNFEIEVKSIDTQDNVFTVNFVFNIVDNALKYYSLLPATGVFVIVDNMLLSLDVSHDAKPEDLEYMQKTRIEYGTPQPK